MSGDGSALKAVIIGASGRMGLGLIRLLPEFPRIRLHAALVGESSAVLGRDSGELAGVTPNGVPISANLEAALKDAALALDFSTESASRRTLPLCASSGTPLLLGTTGLGEDIPELIARAAERIPVLVSANTSLGATVLEDLVRRAAGTLGTGYEVHVHDTHHRHKRDAPSGTALALGRAVSEGFGTDKEVRFSSDRQGDVIGEHEVAFSRTGERLSFQHAVTDRAVFARGALTAALWMVQQPPGSYRMADILKEK